MEVEGTIVMIGETKEVGGNNFKKREVAIETEGQYPQIILLEFVQDKTSLLDSKKVGDKVVIGINLRGRVWVNPEGESVYFNTIQGWHIKDAIDI